MIANSKKLLVLSISLILSSSLLTACGDSDNKNVDDFTIKIDPVDDGSNSNDKNNTSGSDNSSGDTTGGSTDSTDSSVTNPDKPQQIFDVKEFASNAHFEPIQITHWDALPQNQDRANSFHEKIENLNVQNGKVVAVTRWHNRIIKLDTNQKTDTLSKPEFFATLVTSAKKVKSNDNDIISGASEHILSDVEYSRDNHFMYAVVEQPKRDNVDDDTYGLFKVPLNSDGSLPQYEVNGKQAPHRANGVKRVKSVYKMLPLNNGAVLGISRNGDDTVVGYYDVDLNPQENKSFVLPNTDKILSWMADEQFIYILGEYRESKENHHLYLEKRSITNPVEEIKKVDLQDMDIDAIKAAGNHLVLFAKNNVQLLDKEFAILDKVVFTRSIDEFSVSTDNQRIAVSYNKNKHDYLSIIDIEDDKLSNPIAVDVDGIQEIRRLALADKNSLYIDQGYDKSHSARSLTKIDLNQPLIRLTDQQVINRKLENITENTIHQRKVDVDSYNLNLPETDNSLAKPIIYTWQSSNPSVISNDGVVTVPSSGDPVTVTMTVTASVENTNLTGRKDIEVVIKPNSAIIETGIESDLSATLARKITFNDGIAQYFNNTANDDGSLYTLLNEKGIAILQRQANNQLDVALVNDNQKLFMPQIDSSSGVNLTEPKVLTSMWKGNNTLLVLLGGKQSGALVKKEFHDTNNASSIAEQAKQPWSVVKTFSKPVIQGYVDDERHYITIVEDNGEQRVDNSKRYQITVISANSGKKKNYYDIDVNLTKNYAFVADKGKYIWVSDDDNNKLTRYVNGVQDSELDTDGKYYSGVFIKDNMVLSGRSGKLFFIKNALQKTPVTQEQAKIFMLDRANGDKDRVYGLTHIDKKLYASQKRHGVSVVDISNFDEPVPSKFIPYNSQYISIASGDGKYLLQIGYKNSQFKLTPLE